MKYLLWIALLCGLLSSLPLAAQEDSSGEAGQGEAPERAGETDQSVAELEARLNKRIDEETSAQKEEIEQLRKELDDVKEQNEDLVAEMEMGALDAAEGGDFSETKPLTVYGFFDLNLTSFIFEDGSPFTHYIPNTTSFIMSQVNLYFLSEMTKTLNALVEVRLSFLPHGMENSVESIGKVGDEEIPSESVYDRTDTQVRDMLNSVYYNTGGITIERAHLTYMPFDWLNIIAGRYLTPYGIWNVDHGSPVIIPARVPYMQIREMVPGAQTGVQIHGRFFPRYNLFFDYAVTLSNGRGPIEEIIDLDDNKGVGLRLRLSYEGEKFAIAAGGYGYVGEYTDIKKTSVMELNPDMTINRDAANPILTEMVTTESYFEYIASADILVKFLGITLQGEYVWRYVDYSIHGLRTVEHTVFAGAAAFEELYHPSNTGFGVYGLISWELPLSKLLGEVRVTPYFMYERYLQDDTVPALRFDILAAGINVRPSPFVSLKGEFNRVMPNDQPVLGEALTVVNIQLAVSF